MKITIEGEPKEIAAYEQALKGGKDNVDKIAEAMYERLRKTMNSN